VKSKTRELYWTRKDYDTLGLNLSFIFFIPMFYVYVFPLTCVIALTTLSHYRVSV